MSCLKIAASLSSEAKNLLRLYHHLALHRSLHLTTLHDTLHSSDMYTTSQTTHPKAAGNRLYRLNAIWKLLNQTCKAERMSVCRYLGLFMNCEETAGASDEKSDRDQSCRVSSDKFGVPSAVTLDDL
jgi:hypothetical protein